MFLLGVLLLITGAIILLLMVVISLPPTKSKKDRILEENKVLTNKILHSKIYFNNELVEFYKEKIKDNFKKIKIYYSDKEIDEMFSDSGDIKRKGLESNF